jgi:hypothetical protein
MNSGKDGLQLRAALPFSAQVNSKKPGGDALSIRWNG